MDKSKCPDCGQTLANKSQACPDCQDDKDNQKKRKTSGIFQARLLLIVIGIVLLLLAGAVFLFLRSSGQQDTDNPAPATSGKTAVEQKENDDASQTKDEKPDVEKPKPMTLEAILEKHYFSCKDMNLKDGRLVGFQELQTCARKNPEETIIILQFYQKPDAEAEGIELTNANRWCTEAPGKKLSAIKGDQFIALYAGHIDSEPIGEQIDKSIFSPEYIQAGNKVLEEEYEFLESQGLEAEVINACTDF